MRVNSAFAKPLETDPGHEASSHPGTPRMIENLVIDVECRVGLGNQQALTAPVSQKSGGPRVAVADLVVAGFLAIENQADDVRRVLLIEPLLESGVDHVIRGRDYV